MTGATAQIISAYEDSGMSPEQIAEGFEGEYEIAAIKAVLSQFSSRYRKDYKIAVRTGDVAEQQRIGFTEEQEQQAVQVIADQIYSEDEHIAQRAAIFVREDRQGRRDVVSKLSGFGIGIVQFQQLIVASNAALGLDKIDRSAIEARKSKPSAATNVTVDAATGAIIAEPQRKAA